MGVAIFTAWPSLIVLGVDPLDRVAGERAAHRLQDRKGVGCVCVESSSSMILDSTFVHDAKVWKSPTGFEPATKPAATVHCAGAQFEDAAE